MTKARFINPNLYKLNQYFNIFAICDNNLVSKVVQTSGNLGELRDLIHIINNFNNERMFFADKIILVEGIKDKILFENYINIFLKAQKSTKAYEVLEVGGKHNFEKYRKFLNKFEIENYIITDRDYLHTHGPDKIKNLFEVSSKKINRKLKEKKIQIKRIL